jgi:hypothetical protein
MEGGVIKLYEECGCEAVVGHFTSCEKHQPQDYSEESFKAHNEWRDKLLADVAAAQKQQNMVKWLGQDEE